MTDIIKELTNEISRLENELDFLAGELDVADERNRKLIKQLAEFHNAFSSYHLRKEVEAENAARLRRGDL